MKRALLALVLVAACRVQGQTTVFSNLDEENTDGAYRVSESSSGSTVSSIQSQFQEFTTGTANVSLASVTINTGIGETTSGPDDFTVSIYQTNGPTETGTVSGNYLPGTLVQTLSGPANPSIRFNDYTYTASNLTLSANTSYYIVLTETGTPTTSHYGFSGIADSEAPLANTAGWTLVGDMHDVVYSSASGNSTIDETGSNPATEFGEVLAFSATDSGNLSAVPEPSTYALIAGGAALAFVAYRRRPRMPAN